MFAAYGELLQHVCCLQRVTVACLLNTECYCSMSAAYSELLKHVCCIQCVTVHACCIQRVTVACLLHNRVTVACLLHTASYCSMSAAYSELLQHVCCVQQVTVACVLPTASYCSKPATYSELLQHVCCVQRVTVARLPHTVSYCTCMLHTASYCSMSAAYSELLQHVCCIQRVTVACLLHTASYCCMSAAYSELINFMPTSNTPCGCHTVNLRFVTLRKFTYSTQRVATPSSFYDLQLLFLPLSPSSIQNKSNHSRQTNSDLGRRTSYILIRSDKFVWAPNDVALQIVLNLNFNCSQPSKFTAFRDVRPCGCRLQDV